MTINNTAEYEAALLRIVTLALGNPLSGTEAAQELERLSLQVRAYDEIHHPFCDQEPSPASASA